MNRLAITWCWNYKYIFGKSHQHNCITSLHCQSMFDWSLHGNLETHLMTRPGPSENRKTENLIKYKLIPSSRGVNPCLLVYLLGFIYILLLIRWTIFDTIQGGGSNEMKILSLEVTSALSTCCISGLIFLIYYDCVEADDKLDSLIR